MARKRVVGPWKFGTATDLQANALGSATAAASATLTRNIAGAAVGRASAAGQLIGGPPSWTGIPQFAINAGQAVSYALPVTAPAGATITVSWHNSSNPPLKPSWVSFTNGTTPTINFDGTQGENDDVTTLVLTATANGQSANNSPAGQIIVGSSNLLDLPLLDSSQITYLGTVTIPNSTAYPAAGIGWGGVSGSNRQFLAAHGWVNSYQLRRFNLPASTGTATEAQGPTSVTLSGFNNQSDIRMYGTLQTNGKVLYSCSADYNGGGGSQSAFVCSINPSTFGSRTTPQATSGLPAYHPGMRGICGWFAEIPLAWRTLLNNNDVFCGTNCKSIVSNDMIGPGFVAFNSNNVTGSGSIPTDKWLLWGHGDGPTSYMLWLGNGRYGAGENVNTAGAAIIPGTRTLLYFGHQGTGAQVYNTGSGDPCNPYQGDHAYPYEFQAWAFDMRDIIAVKNGTMQPYEPRPYATRAGQNNWNFFGWKLNGPSGSCQRTMYTSGFYDYGTNRIYMGQTDASVLHVWQVNV